jgi:hypothetical protein
MNGTTTLAHRKVWTEANGPIPDGMKICHHCDNPACVNLEHLFMGTHQDNMDDMVAKGRKRRGEQHANHVLTEQDVIAIRGVHAKGDNSLREIGEMFGVTYQTIWMIVTRQQWKHVE